MCVRACTRDVYVCARDARECVWCGMCAYAMHAVWCICTSVCVVSYIAVQRQLQSGSYTHPPGFTSQDNRTLLRASTLTLKHALQGGGVASHHVSSQFPLGVSECLSSTSCPSGSSHPPSAQSLTTAPPPFPLPSGEQRLRVWAHRHGRPSDALPHHH